MKYKALVTFAGKITKTKGDIFEINDTDIVKDLLEAEYIKKVSNRNKSEEIEEENNNLEEIEEVDQNEDK